jgi:hypothetical protein
VANKSLIGCRFSFKGAIKLGRGKHAATHDISNENIGIAPVLQFGDKEADGGKKNLVGGKL